MNVSHWIVVACGMAGAYLLGSAPFGVIVARSRGVDLRKVGSGNVGATNVARALGRRWGYLVFVLDMLKGLVPTAVAGRLLVAPDASAGPAGVPTAWGQLLWLSVALAVIAGHVFSVFLGFRGGKGVATALGVVLGIWPYFTWAGLSAFALWIVVLLVSHYVSLASIVAAAGFAPLLIAFNRGRLVPLWPLLAFALGIIILIIVRHRSNIRRLLSGTENRFY